MATPRLYREHFGPHFSEAARQLWVLLLASGHGPEWVRHELGLGRSMANRYLYGDRLPELDQAVKIQDRFGIEPRLWVTKPVRKFVLPACRPVRRARKAA